MRGLSFLKIALKNTTARGLLTVVCLSAVFYFFSLPFVYAQSSKPLNLNEAIEQCLKNNPQIQAAKQRYLAAKSRVALFRTLEDPKIEYEYDKITADMDAVTRGRTSPMRTIAISQEIPFPGKLSLRKQADQKEAEIFQQEYKETEQRVIKDLKDAYFQMFLVSRKMSLTKENLGLLSGFVEIADKRYAANKSGQQDSLKAQVEYSRLSNQLVLLEEEEKIAGFMLDSLLDKQQGEVVFDLDGKASKELELKEEDVLAAAKENRPELKSFMATLKKSEIDFALSKEEYIPDVMLKYKREERNGSLGSWSGMVGVSIPLWFWDKQKSMVKESQANLGVVKAEYKAAENMVVYEARSAYAKFDAAKKLAKMYETGILPQAKAAEENAGKGYESGQVSFLDLLDSLRSLRDFQMEYFEALANVEIALADLERSAGTEFGR